jgi:hypothetical protein
MPAPTPAEHVTTNTQQGNMRLTSSYLQHKHTTPQQQQQQKQQQKRRRQSASAAPPLI